MSEEKNSYIPRFISNTPWYVNDSEESKKNDYLEHQRSSKRQIDTTWYDRGKHGQRATKYRKGACTNCGAMTHKAVDCVERPRKVGAKYTGQDIQPDEIVQEINTTWDSKRDRWNGYDASEYKQAIKKFEILNPEGPEEGDEDKVDVKPARVAVRSREDRAKYLEDTNDESFNPKSRTLRNEGEVNDQGYYERDLTGDALTHQQMREQAEKLAESGEKIHIEANPTEGYLKLKQQREEKKRAKQVLLEKYGSAGSGASRPKETVPLDQSEHSKPKEQQQIPQVSTKSSYVEDVYPGNHSSVWGSYWEDGKWGFQCCHSLIKQSYCVPREKYDEIKRTFAQNT